MGSRYDENVRNIAQIGLETHHTEEHQQGKSELLGVEQRIGGVDHHHGNKKEQEEMADHSQKEVHTRTLL